jgi:hypothetical protein
MKPYTVDERHSTRAAALEAEERHWAYIRGDKIKADIVAKIASSTELNVAYLDQVITVSADYLIRQADNQCTLAARKRLGSR